MDGPESLFTGWTLLDAASFMSDVFTTIFTGIATWIAIATFLREPKQDSESSAAIDEPDDETDPPVQLKSLVVFRTSQQVTHLIATDQGLECHLENTKINKPSGTQWRLSRAEVTRILAEHDFRVTPGFRPNSGTFSIGPRRNWLYSKSLYPSSVELSREIASLLKTVTETEQAE